MSWFLTAIGWGNEPVGLEITECGICHALVESDSFSSHVEWHSEVER
jgi:hypothetical protein